MKKTIYLTLISLFLIMNAGFGQTPEKMMEKINKAQNYNIVNLETKCGTITYKYEEDYLRLISYDSYPAIGKITTNYYFTDNGVFSILQRTIYNEGASENGNDSTYFLFKDAKVYKAITNGKEEKITDADVKAFLDEIETMVQMSQVADKENIINSEIICLVKQNDYNGGEEAGDYDPELAQKTKERLMNEGWECVSAQLGITLPELFNGDWDIDAEQSTVNIKLVTNADDMVDFNKSTWVEKSVENVESRVSFCTTNDCEARSTLVSIEQIDTLIVFTYPESASCYTFDVFQKDGLYQLVLTSVGNPSFQRFLYRGPRG